MPLAARVSDLAPFELLLSMAGWAKVAIDAAAALDAGIGTLRASRDAALRDGAADIGFVEGPDRPAGLSARVAGSDVLTVVVCGSHPWARRSGITAAELAAGRLRAVRVTGLDLRRTLHAVSVTGRQLTGPAADLLAIAVSRAGGPGSGA